MDYLMFPNIDAERIKKRMSQEDFMKAIGYTSRKNYYTWLHSGKIPTAALIEMSKLFDCSTDYLLGLSEIRKFEIKPIV